MIHLQRFHRLSTQQELDYSQTEAYLKLAAENSLRPVEKQRSPSELIALTRVKMLSEEDIVLEAFIHHNSDREQCIRAFYMHFLNEEKIKYFVF